MTKCLWSVKYPTHQSHCLVFVCFARCPLLCTASVQLRNCECDQTLSLVALPLTLFPSLNSHDLLTSEVMHKMGVMSGTEIKEVFPHVTYAFSMLILNWYMVGAIFPICNPKHWSLSPYCLRDPLAIMSFLPLPMHHLDQLSCFGADTAVIF